MRRASPEAVPDVADFRTGAEAGRIAGAEPSAYPRRVDVLGARARAASCRDLRERAEDAHAFRRGGVVLLERPFEEHPGNEALAGFPPDWASSLSISCSS